MGRIFWELSGAAGTGEPKFPSLPWDLPEEKGIFTGSPSLELGKEPLEAPNPCPFPTPGMQKGILIPQNPDLPMEGGGGGVGMMQQPELLQSGIGKLEQQPRLGHGEGGKSLRKWLKLFQRKARKASHAKNALFQLIWPRKQEHAQERRIPPGGHGAAPGIPGNEEMPLDARIKIPGVAFQPFSALFPFIGAGEGEG